MAEIRNPFEHHHGSDHGPGHDHGHDHDHASHDESLDPAQQSLNDALRVSFWVLKVAMLIVVILYMSSGIFSVSSQDVAVRLRFGKIVGAPGEQEISADGLHFAFPYPIEQVIRIPKSIQQLELATEFWFNLRPEEVGFELDKLTSLSGMRSRPLDPQVDGSLVTGDANIVHARWSISYKIDSGRAVEYLKNIGDAKVAQQTVRSASEAGIVRAVASLTADEIIKGQINREETIRYIQQRLDSLGSGIVIEQLSISNPTPPLAVRDMFQAVTRAESDKARDIQKALQDRGTILGETAGEASTRLLEMIRAYEHDLAVGDTKIIAEREAQIDTAFDLLKTTPEFGAVPVSGLVAQVINEAKSYRSSIDAQIQADATRFLNYFNSFKNNPSQRRIVINQLWQEARSEILTGDVETLYLPPGRAWIKINRDPDVARQRQLDDLRARGVIEETP